MEHDLHDTIALLLRTPAALDALLRDLPEVWTAHNEGGDTFNVLDVVGHLIYADRVDWIPRANMILQFGENRPFEPFDRMGHVEECQGKTLSQLLNEFARVRYAAIDELRSLELEPPQLTLRGHHPALGRLGAYATAIESFPRLHQRCVPFVLWCSPPRSPR